MGAARQSAQATLNYFRPVFFWVTKLQRRHGWTTSMSQQQCSWGVTSPENQKIATNQDYIMSIDIGGFLLHFIQKD